MPDLEHKVVSLPIDKNLQGEVDKLVQEGWNLPPGILPIAIYQLVRVKPGTESAAPSGDAHGILQIDDSKIMVIPAGGKAN